MIPLLDIYKERWQVASDTAIKPGLASIEQALKILGSPEKELKVVHFAGTNGKGSTLTFVEAMAREYSLSVGKFMSPCVVDVHDQIQINGVNITAQQLDSIFQQLHECGLSGKLTDFELLTVIAFVFFKQQHVDLVLLEAGMGGRVDSTNVVNPIVSVITSIALDHTNFLGTTLSSIAAHKAGIIKQGRPVVLGEVPQEVQFIFEKEAQIKNTSIEKYGREFIVTFTAQGETYTHIKKGFSFEQLSRQFLGPHQGKNMALAITAFLQVLQAFDLPVEALKINQAISKAKLSGRFEQVLPNVYFDGAHNPASIEMLVQTIQQQFPTQRIEFIVGLLADKDVDSILTMLEQVSETFYFVDIDNPRAMPAQQLLEKSNAIEKSIVSNVGTLLQMPTKNEKVLIVTGSLYLLSEIRQKLTLL
ncbi:bifunctional folylpolyglutamate synthase/dihydrofolate synthase [Solibacillus sp. MA9]|uniref:tetrahydrofolate synthase n=1 Tax=Solibacillus palustris TaxID=2908203 RepID=A0ABS9UD43_9BACL|nr:folylpolyglutamate synthase/dihydrofolate synthase family protein [Solibacillus sp. MA9]MCH7322244.1 bifunctional folylpolyglutamate synthase/dihydrofolate synthase [Solibacillus sp. MA9]